MGISFPRSDSIERNSLVGVSKWVVEIGRAKSVAQVRWRFRAQEGWRARTQEAAPAATRGGMKGQLIAAACSGGSGVVARREGEGSEVLEELNETEENERN
ncbi:hypothetical protein NL676_038986 [Syzygium grande]|nr:hypothetical protein NL676_038986 [Syzygium grande]